MTRERIEEVKKIVVPFMVHKLKQINYEGLGEVDAEEFEKDFNEILDLATKALEQEPTTKNDCETCIHNQGVLECDIYGCDYEPTTKNDLGVDAVSRQAVLDKKELVELEDGQSFYCISPEDVETLPSVTPQEPKTGHCRDCKWWKDSDGAYRRGVGAESQCPINRKEVYEGNGYCFLYEPQESEET